MHLLHRLRDDDLKGGMSELRWRAGQASSATCRETRYIPCFDQTRFQASRLWESCLTPVRARALPAALACAAQHGVRYPRVLCAEATVGPLLPSACVTRGQAMGRARSWLARRVTGGRGAYLVLPRARARPAVQTLTGQYLTDRSRRSPTAAPEL